MLHNLFKTFFSGWYYAAQTTAGTLKEGWCCPSKSPPCAHWPNDTASQTQRTPTYVSQGLELRLPPQGEMLLPSVCCKERCRNDVHFGRSQLVFLTFLLAHERGSIGTCLEISFTLTADLILISFLCVYQYCFTIYRI